MKISLTQLRPELYPGLARLAAQEGWEYDPGQPFNPDLSLVAMDGDKVVGFIAAWHDGHPYGWVDGFIVDRAYRGTEAAMLLATSMRAVLLSRGCNAIRLVVANPRLAAVLEKYGFTVKENYIVMEWRNDGTYDGRCASGSS